MDLQDIRQIKKIEHINHKKDINNPTDFWDRLENSIRNRQLKMPWSGFSYMNILGKNGDMIILTSLMKNYKNIPYENIETKYVRFPLIKK